MKRSGDQALDQALAFHRAPGYLAAIRRLALPEDLQTLLRIAAGDSEATHDAAQRTGESPEALREVTIFYLQQLLFADDGDSYRVLGVSPDASDEQIKLHYRWLARWLHPDRNPDEWETVFADRVNRAWQDLRTPDRRIAYDQNRPQENHLTYGHTDRNAGLRESAMPEPMLAPGPLRWLPALALGGVAVFAVTALLLFRQPAQVAGPESIVDVAPEPTTNAAHDGWIPAASPADTPRPAPPAAAELVSPRAEPQPEPTGPAVSPPSESSLAEATIPAPSVVAAAHVELPPALAAIRGPVTGNTLAANKPANVMADPNSGPQLRPTPTAEKIGLAAPATVPMPPKSEHVATTAMTVPKPMPMPLRATTPPQAVQPPVTTARVETVAFQTPSPPAPSARPTPNDNSPPNLIDDRIAASLASRFSQAYANGDTDQLMQLFTHDAQNGHGDRRAIAEDYRRLFEASERRRIALSDLSWLAVGNGVTIIGSFETEVVPRGKTHGEHVSGDIRFDLREENGELRIYRLSHDNRRS